ncbi:MAG TPA: TIM44-like domain-containing protein [Thermoanaerobaculia bacterium]|jgi:hypothetical protein
MKRIALVLALLLLATTAQARIGGGESYSGDSSSSSSSSDSSSSYSDSSDSYSGPSGSSSSGSSSGGDDGGMAVVIMIFMAFFVFAGLGSAAKPPRNIILSVAPTHPAPVSLDALRGFDPNFSEIVFTDFCYSLFARVYEALGQGRVDAFAPYVSAPVREGLKQQAPAGLTAIDGVVIGSFSVAAIRALDQPRVEVDVEFEANYSEVTAAGTRRWYVSEVWTLTRTRDLLSPPPDKARAEHCPKCGAPLETRTDGTCLYCRTAVRDGSFHWFVQSIRGVKKDERPPQLGGGGSGPEPGLDRATVVQPWIARNMKTYKEKHPGFSWEAFDARVRFVAKELQDAWTARDWRRARPLETGALFQMHRYWIDEYLRQGVVNRVDDYQIDQVEVAKVTSDAFYDVITVRLYASGRDSTVDAAGNLIGGSSQFRKQWSEYWTFVRGRAAAADAPLCPNCGADRSEGQTAVCEYCGGTIVSGDFPWVLSRIEQDEAYRG